MTLIVRPRRFGKTLTMSMLEHFELALHNLSKFLTRCYGKKPLILLDEYDTPMQGAYRRWVQWIYQGAACG